MTDQTIHSSVPSSAVSQITIILNHLYNFIEMEDRQAKGKICWLLNSEWYIIGNIDKKVYIICARADIIVQFSLWLPRSHTSAPILAPPLTSVFQCKQIPGHARLLFLVQMSPQCICSIPTTLQCHLHTNIATCKASAKCKSVWKPHYNLPDTPGDLTSTTT